VKLVVIREMEPRMTRDRVKRHTKYREVDRHPALQALIDLF